MNPTFLRAAAFGLAIAAVPGTAQAAQFLQTQTQAQTKTGQNFLFSFAGLPTPTGAGTLTFDIRGDFSVDHRLAHIEGYGFDLEGVRGATGLGQHTGTVIDYFNFDDRHFTQSIALSLEEMSALASDGQIDLAVDYAFGVDVFRSANPFISVSLAFATGTLPANPVAQQAIAKNPVALAAVSQSAFVASNVTAVPEPAGWALMLLGFFGIGGMMRRRERQSVAVSYS